MRIITGIARGRRLETPEGSDVVRPTSDKVKEAIFSMIQFELEGARVLDLFAGSGQLGLEAVSRGADSAVFVDAAHSSVELIKRNISACGFSDSCRAYKADFKAFLNGCDTLFDLVLLDPPYAADLMNTAVELSAKKLASGGIIICEHSTDLELHPPVGFTARTKTYGKTTAVTLLRKEAEQ